MLALDTDQSTQAVNAENDSYLSQTSLPEYVVYVQDQLIHIYDLSTRHDHLLADFSTQINQEDNVNHKAAPTKCNGS